MKLAFTVQHLLNCQIESSICTALPSYKYNPAEVLMFSFFFHQVANDEIGGTVLSELKEAGIDISHVIVRLGLQIYNFCIFVHQALQCK